MASVPATPRNFLLGLGLGLLLLWRCEFERLQVFVFVVERVDRAPDDAEVSRELMRACPRVIAATGIERGGEYGRVRRPF